MDEAAISLQNYSRLLEESLTTNQVLAEGSKSSLRVVNEHRLALTLTLIGYFIPVNRDKNILGV